MLHVESITQSIMEEFGLLERDLVVKVYKTFRTRIMKVIAADGGYIDK